MWYKIEDENWLVASEVRTPLNGELIKLDNTNTEMEINDWFWSEEEPADYLEWKNSRDLEEEEVDNE